jgi:hypothetical protein
MSLRLFRLLEFSLRLLLVKGFSLFDESGSLFVIGLELILPSLCTSCL